ncbi:MAG: ribosome biogenesis GTP-binding protein YihA/YsxC [Desulfobacterales bacterium]|nr:ribosome biogenesis GTP-binding protein YihA/YsxC [Desulfobacterales bacterium]
MIIKSAQFITSATQPSQYPPAVLPEIAFCGRSNVGKSSLINALVNRKSLVKTSNTPGRTQLVNFFDINGAFSFVDLPGYGYARVPIAVKRKWPAMIETYLSTRKTLKGVVLIMDLRRTPNQEETNLIDWFDYHGIAKILILTKADKLSKTGQKAQHESFAKSFETDKSRLILFSTKSKQGMENVWQAIENLIETSETDSRRIR